MYVCIYVCMYVYITSVSRPSPSVSRRTKTLLKHAIFFSTALHALSSPLVCFSSNICAAVCACVCVYVCTWIMHIWRCFHSLYLSVYAHARLCGFMHVFCAYFCVFLFSYTCMYIHEYTYTHTYIWLYMYVHIYLCLRSIEGI
jgi:hypothetical protein